MDDINNPRHLTLAVKLPADLVIELSSEVELNGHKVECQSICFETNAIRESFALQQRLEAALDIVRSAGWTDEYKQKLQDLRDENDLIELPEHDFDE